MANPIGNSLSDSYVTRAKRLAQLHQTSVKLSKEEKVTKDGGNGSEEFSTLISTCAKCRGDAEQSEQSHIEDLCPVDKKRISELIERFTELSTKARYQIEEKIIVLEEEKKALEIRYQELQAESKKEKTELQEKLVHAITELNKLRLQISQSLDLISQQIKAQENQFSQLTITSKNLVQEKLQLEKALIETNTNLLDAKAKVERVRESAEMERLMLLKEYMQKLNVKTEETACQTQELEQLIKDEVSERQKNNRTKSCSNSPKTKDDLEEMSTDGKLIQDLFFKRPSITEDESLEIPIPSIFCNE